MEEQGVVLTIPDFMKTEMTNTKGTLSQYPKYKEVAAVLIKYVPKKIVAGLIGCIIPECGCKHNELNKTEYNGKGTSGTQGWNCGEGFVQWTFWKSKVEKIREYNADSRSTQKLPETWEEYSKGEPVVSGNYLVAQPDGKHIAGLSLENQVLFLLIYYKNEIKSLENEKNLAVITAKFYQRKAGIGFKQEIKEPIERAYKTAARHYHSGGNTFLRSIKYAQEFYNCPIDTTNVEYDFSSFGSSSYSGGGGGTSWGGAGGSGLRDSRLSAKKPLKMKKGVLLGSHLNPK